MKDNKMEYNPNSDNMTEEDDYKTASILKSIANTIEKDIQFTTDVPSKGENSKMPVLDLAIWTEYNSIEYTFYRKKVSSIYTVMRRSAVTTRTKLDTVFQESLRRLYNVSPRLPW